MTDQVFNVLFLCTANSARSVLAESLMNHWGRGRFRGFSAGSFPRGEIHPMALELLRSLHLPTDGLRSKSWDEFGAPGAPEMDFIFTVCDNAAGEICPIWPGHPVTAHWGVADPAAVTGDEMQQRQAFREALRQLENRIRIFTSLRFDALDRSSLQGETQRIGNISLEAQKT